MIDSHTESSTIKVDNVDVKMPINSKNGVTFINIDVPDSRNAEKQISLDENRMNARKIASTATAKTITTAISAPPAIEQDAADSIGGDAWLRQKQWHRRLHTPVWARCSIKNHIFIYTICALFTSLSVLLSLYIYLTLSHTFFYHRLNLFISEKIEKK